MKHVVLQLQGQLCIWQEGTDFGHEAVKLCHWMRYLVAGCVLTGNWAMCFLCYTVLD